MTGFALAPCMLAITLVIEGRTWIGFLLLLSVTWNCNQLRIQKVMQQWINWFSDLSKLGNENWASLTLQHWRHTTSDNLSSTYIHNKPGLWEDGSGRPITGNVSVELLTNETILFNDQSEASIHTPCRSCTTWRCRVCPPPCHSRTPGPHPHPGWRERGARSLWGGWRWLGDLGHIRGELHIIMTQGGHWVIMENWKYTLKCDTQEGGVEAEWRHAH